MTTAALTPLTPTELIKDIRTLDRIANDWLLEGRLDAITEEDIKYKRGDLMDQLREHITTERDGPGWMAHLHEWDLGDPIGNGPTEARAIQDLMEELELIGEDVA